MSYCVFATLRRVYGISSHFSSTLLAFQSHFELIWNFPISSIISLGLAVMHCNAFFISFKTFFFSLPSLPNNSKHLLLRWLWSKLQQKSEINMKFNFDMTKTFANLASLYHTKEVSRELILHIVQWIDFLLPSDFFVHFKSTN